MLFRLYELFLFFDLFCLLFKLFFRAWHCPAADQVFGQDYFLDGRPAARISKWVYR